MHTLTVATHDHAKCPVGDPTCPAYVAYRDTQPLQAAITERIRELKHAIRFYDDRGWDDLANEYRVRLDELQKLTPQRLAAAIERVETEPELREAFGK